MGKQLFAFLARRAAEHGCGRMEWAVLNWNEAAIGFYKGLGAEAVRDWTVFHLGREEMTTIYRADDMKPSR